MIQWHIGCSGFYYKHWKDAFYPEDLAQSKWFSYYAEHFKSLELNSSFYRFPQLKTLLGWKAKSPDDFKFIIKANRLITHYKKFNEVKEPLSEFYNLINKGLAEKCGGILFQLPPSFHYSPEALEKICTELNPDFTNIVEFRHESWWQQSVYNELAKHRITFSGISHPMLPDDVIANSEVLYYRFHGKEKLYASSYSDKFLREIYTNIKAQKHVKTAWLMLNNDLNSFAIDNAKTIAEFTK